MSITTDQIDRDLRRLRALPGTVERAALDAEAKAKAVPEPDEPPAKRRARLGNVRAKAAAALFAETRGLSGLPPGAEYRSFPVKCAWTGTGAQEVGA